MSKQLDEQVTKVVLDLSGTINDYDQRSAIGMARSWIDNGELAVWHPDKSKDQVQYPKRDALATAIVEILAGATKREDMVAALAGARAKVNEPFVDASMAAFQAARVKRGLVGSEKKNLKTAGK